MDHSRQVQAINKQGSTACTANKRANKRAHTASTANNTNIANIARTAITASKHGEQASKHSTQDVFLHTAGMIKLLTELRNVWRLSCAVLRALLETRIRHQNMEDMNTDEEMLPHAHSIEQRSRA